MTPKDRARLNELLAMRYDNVEYYRSLDALEALKHREAHEKNIALVGAFLMEGFVGVRGEYTEALDALDQGAVEAIGALTQYAPFIQELYEEECIKRDDSAPGVYVYEVVSPFGDWFRKCIMVEAKIKTGSSVAVEPPPEKVCLAWIRAETEKFFNQ